MSHFFKADSLDEVVYGVKKYCLLIYDQENSDENHPCFAGFEKKKAFFIILPPEAENFRVFKIARGGKLKPK